MKSGTAQHRRRPYRMGARREAELQTRQQILEVAYRLWTERDYDEVTLDAIAELAGVSRQTVHRQFGSKDDLFLAVVDWRQPHEDEAVVRVEPGDVTAAVACFIDRYERLGDALVRFLAIEGRIAAVDELLQRGRAGHRSELEHAFAPFLPADRDLREQVLLALYAATDVMVWKLVRRDCGHSRDTAENVMRQLVDGVVTTSSERQEPTP